MWRLRQGDEITKRVNVDASNVGYDDSCAILCNASRERFKPAVAHLCVAVQKQNDGVDGLNRTAQPCTDNPVVHAASHQAHFVWWQDSGESCEVLVERCVFVHLRVVVYENDLTQQRRWRPIENTNHVAEQCRQGLVVEDDDH